MLEPNDYLNLDARSARAQLESLLVRRPAVAGRRQVDFLPVETLLCLAASLVVNHRRYGGSTAHLAEQPVPTLAVLFKRPNSSILAKMANLDGSRTNGAKAEIQVASELLAQPERLGDAYRLILTTAREIGVGHGTLPDFLGIEEPWKTLVLEGQQELSSNDLARVLEEESPHWTRPDIDTDVTQRLITAVARIGQHRFAKRVLANCGQRCVFCGLRSPRGAWGSLLIASHIKPWRACSPSERLDHRNGLAACPTHDRAFDFGLLTVDVAHQILLSPRLNELVASEPVAQHAFGRPPLAKLLLMPETADPPLARFLMWHNSHAFDPGN